MSTLISKTTFIDSRNCIKNTWLKLHKAELLVNFELSEFEKQLIEQGNEVEECARKLFPLGVEVTSTGENACIETMRYMESKVPAIFQATFIADGFIARNDVLVYDKNNDCWDLYEIKGTNSLKEGSGDRSHVEDVAFQAVVLRRANMNLGRSFLVHLNKDYVRVGDLDIEQLFIIEDLTETVAERFDEISILMDGAREFLSQENEPPSGCDCHYLGRSRHCATFPYSHPKIPEYSVHDLSRIGSSKKKLEFFAENEIYRLEDIPYDFELSPIQTNQLEAYLTQKITIDYEEIHQQLKNLRFPLYFFDYETYAPAIPSFANYSPYKRIPFQFSLHILRDPMGELDHVEFLHPTRTDPSELVAKLLNEYIKPEGTIIAWNKSFEIGVNNEIAQRLPEYRELLERVNGQFYDLMEVFSKQHYIHPDFRGSASIKKVLPVLVPELQYKDLAIHEGGQASEQWWFMVSPTTSEENYAEVSRNLKEYCKLDTYAMYAIWKHLYQITEYLSKISEGNIG